jgi:hypothetical protein
MASAVFTESLARHTALASGEAGRAMAPLSRFVHARARGNAARIASRRPPMLLRVGGAIH